MDIVEQIAKLFMDNLDILFVASIVIVVEVAKRNLPKVPKKLWTFVTIALGFLLAWLKMPTIVGHGKEYVILSVEYAAGAVLLYEVTKNLLTALKNHLVGKHKGG
jgi:hypothetical protein